MPKINIEKITKELSKGNADEQHDAYLKVKDFVAATMAAAQKEADEKANELQSKIDKLNNS